MPRLSPEEVRDFMTSRLEDAMYPVLIPVEQQDMRIQEENRRAVELAAIAAWNTFCEATSIPSK
jgi:hypothetical protein